MSIYQYEHLPAAALWTGAVQEVAHASPGFARLSMISNRLALVFTQHCDWQWTISPGKAHCGIGWAVLSECTT